MTSFKVKSSVLNRLASVCSFFDSSVTDDRKKMLKTIRLENRNGHLFGIATNQRIASIEYLGVTKEPNDAAHLIISDSFIRQMFTESLTDNIITVNTIPEIGLSSLTSVSGYNSTNCCHWFDDTPLQEWREWADNVKKTSCGAMYLDLFNLETLIKASPTGKVVFPEHVDINIPVVLKDYGCSTWAGLFFAQPPEGITIKEGAELPEWWNI